MGTIINVLAILAGGIGGLFFGSLLKEKVQHTVLMGTGLAIVFIGIAGTMEGMLKLSPDGQIVSRAGMMVTISMAAGGLIGEVIDFENYFERFGEWLKQKSGSSGDHKFVDAFVNASLAAGIGAMAIVGSIQNGILGDYTILATKSVIDFFIIFSMTASLGKGCIFSAIPIFFMEGGMTLLAGLLAPFMTEAALAGIAMVGSIMIACVGINLVWGKMIKTVNFIPALFFAAIMANFPFFF